MKKLLLFNLLFLFTLILSAQKYYMSSPEGFAEGVTGGGNATPIVVDNYNEFKTAINDTNDHFVILIDGTIAVPEGGQISTVLKNKTILGLPGAKLVSTAIGSNNSGILNLKRYSENVIIRNLIFEGPGAYDVDGRDLLSSQGCDGLWVDHCEFSDGLDGNFDITNYADNTTISWTKFEYKKPAISGGSGGSNDHRFSNLVGGSASSAPEDGHYSITYLNNYWAEGCKERMPRARNADLHIVNCFISTSVSGATAIGLGGGINNSTCYVEKSNYKNINSVFKAYNSDGGEYGVTFDNCIGAPENQGTIIASKPSYTFTSYPAEHVEEFVTNSECGAGANLNIDIHGVISSNCASLGIANKDSALAVTAYPTFFDHSIFLRFPNTVSGPTHLSIYSVNGYKVFSLSKNIKANETIELRLPNLASGMYVCKIKNGNDLNVIKMIRK